MKRSKSNKKATLTRKQLKYISGRSMHTVDNWANKRAEMPEHIHCVKEEIEKFINQKKKEIEEHENGSKK